MKASTDKIEFLYQFSRALHTQHLDLRRTLQTVLTMTAKALDVQQGCLVTFRNHMTIENAYIFGAGPTPAVTPEIWDILLRRGLVGFVYHSDRRLIIRNIQTDPRWPKLPDVPFLPRTGSAIGIPLHKGSFVYGVMVFLHPQVDYFTDDALELLDELVEIANIAVGNALDFHAARTNDTRYQSLFEDAVVPILLSDMRGSILDMNRKACDFLGKGRTELLRKSITELHPLETDYDMTLKLAQLAEGEEVYFRTITRASDGDVPTLIRARRIQLEGRSVIEWVEQDLRIQMELEQLRRDLTAMVYHDLRGPLQTILGSIYKLGDVLRNHDNPVVLTLLQLGIRSTRQLERMVDSLLDVQRLEAGDAILDTKPIEIRVLLTDAIQLMQPLAIQNNQRLQFDIADDLPLVEADGDMMMRVVINLIQNAIKYTPDGGIIKVSAKCDGSDVVTISVSDSGPGIPAHFQKQIFDKYSRIKYRDAPKGLGLGLAFCRLAVEAHRGRIWVESDGKNGSTFYFTLPVTNDATSTTTRAQLATA